MARRLDIKLLVGGYAVIGLAIIGVAAWLVIAGPPEPVTLGSITVPVESLVALPTQTTELPRGLLPSPRASSNGLESARVFDATDKRPRIAILIMDLGPSREAAESAIKTLPPDISLAFLPFSTDTPSLADEARSAGHEILLDIPMEPSNYPDDDPGPDALLTTVSDAENLRRLNWDLARTSGYVGVVNFMGSRFTTAQEKLKPVFAALHDHGLVVVDTKVNSLTAIPGLARDLKMPFVVADVAIDAGASRDTIDENLAKLESIARQQGSALGIASSYPLTIERVAEWAKSLTAKGFVLAPVSALATANMPKG